MKRHLFASLFAMLIFVEPAAAFFGGEFSIAPSLGGSEFRSNNETTNNTTAWDFPYINNAGIAISLKLGVRTDLLGFGVTGQAGWKEDAFDNTPESMGNFLGIKYYDSRTADFYLQYNRVLTGGYIQIFIPVSDAKLHFYAEYNPAVYAIIHHTKDSTTLKKEDKMSGSGFATGLGFGSDKTIFRILYRSITYNKFRIDDVDYELPAIGYSTVKTGEMEFHIGVQF